MGRRLIHWLCIALVLGAGTTVWGQQKKATNPIPADGTMDKSVPALRWTAGSTAKSHDVYLGTSPQLGVADRIATKLPLQTTFVIRQGLQGGVKYYWRVDELDRDGVTVHTGDVWSFTEQ